MKGKKKISFWKKVWYVFSVLGTIGSFVFVFYAEAVVVFVLDQVGPGGFLFILPVFLIIVGISVGGIFDLLGDRRCLRCRGSGFVPAHGAWASEYDADTCPRCGGLGREPQ